MAHQLRAIPEHRRVATAVASGDLSLKITVDVSAKFCS